MKQHKFHIWRYLATEPVPEPWIVSRPGDDAESFDTWQQAIAYVTNTLVRGH